MEEGEARKGARSQRSPEIVDAGDSASFRSEVPERFLGVPSLTESPSPTYATGAENCGKPLIIGKRCQKVSTTTWGVLLVDSGLRTGDFGTGLVRQTQSELPQQQKLIFFRLGVARENQPPSVGGG
jgi:hypothetical protein